MNAGSIGVRHPARKVPAGCRACRGRSVSWPARPGSACRAVWRHALSPPLHHASAARQVPAVVICICLRRLESMDSARAHEHEAIERIQQDTGHRTQEPKRKSRSSMRRVPRGLRAEGVPFSRCKGPRRRSFVSARLPTCRAARRAVMLSARRARSTVQHTLRPSQPSPPDPDVPRHPSARPWAPGAARLGP